MKLLGLYLGRHDSNISLADGEKVIYFKAERMYGIKHEFRPYRWVKEVCKANRFVPDAVAYSDGDRNGLGQCKKDQLYCKAKSLFGVPTYCLDHYYAHVLSAWPVVDMQGVDVGVGIDGKGDHSFSRRLIAHPGDLSKVKSLDRYKGKGVGRFFAKVGHFMGLKVGRLSTGLDLTIDYAGKVMGAQAYGRDTGGITVSPRKAFNDPYSLLKSMPKKAAFGNKKFLSWLADAHALIEKGLFEYFRNHCSAKDRVVYAGGVAQNTVYNDGLFSMYPDLHIPPHCYDGGMSLGCVEFLRMRYDRPSFSRDGFPYWQRDFIDTIPTPQTMDRVASLLADGKIVGWFQGHGEIGPRALGNRSILMHPGLKDGKQRLNNGVKHREHWRPYAPSVLEEYAQDWFLGKPSPYMLRTVQVISDKIPAVTHVDGTSRAQSVSKKQPLFSWLIELFRQKTDIPMMLNTSLNGGGEPIYSTPKQCMRLFKNTDMDAICIGKDLHEKAK